MAPTQDCNRWRQTSISEQSLAINFSIRVVRVRVARRPLHSRPLSDGTVPAYDAVKHTAVILKTKHQDKPFMQNRFNLQLVPFQLADYLAPFFWEL